MCEFGDERENHHRDTEGTEKNSESVPRSLLCALCVSVVISPRLKVWNSG